MRKRHMKKLAKSNPKWSYYNLYKIARTRGSKALCRRARSFRRLGRSHRREGERRHRDRQEFLAWSLVYEPKNEAERLQCAESRAKCEAAEKRYEASLDSSARWKRLAVLTKKLSVASNIITATLSPGKVPMWGGESSKVWKAIGEELKGVKFSYTPKAESA